MAMHVGKALLDDTKKRGLDFARAPFEIFAEFQFYVDATAGGKTSDVIPDCSDQTELL